MLSSPAPQLHSHSGAPLALKNLLEVSHPSGSAQHRKTAFLEPSLALQARRGNSRPSSRFLPDLEAEDVRALRQREWSGKSAGGKVLQGHGGVVLRDLLTGGQGMESQK